MSWSTNRRTRRPFLHRREFNEAEEMRIANEFLAERANHAVVKGSQYLNANPKANGFTILHDDATGGVYDVDRPQDLLTLHNVLPREDLYIVARDNNNELLDSLQTALTSPQEIVNEFGDMPGYRVTTTGGWRDKDGRLHIDHGVLMAISKEYALALGHRWNQQSILELDNRGDSLKVIFYLVE